MAVYTYIGYAPSAISFGGGTVSVAPGFDPVSSRVTITVDDAAGGRTLGGSQSRADLGFRFDGDRFNNEQGDDLTQDGTVTEMDGTPIDSGAIYLEQGWTLTAAGQPTITLYRVEIEGTLVGYIPSEPLVEGVSYAISQFNVTPSNAPDSRDPDALADVPCFVAGTRIATPGGAVAIEDLRAGDPVLCADGQTAWIAWSGRRAVLPPFLSDQRLWPIRIAAGALGSGLPERDLLLSPNHRVLLNVDACALLFGVSEVLVPAKFLVQLDGVSQVRHNGPVVYCHIMFDRHRVILAEGAASESLYPGDVARGAFHREARDELLTLFPELEQDGSGAFGPAAATVLRKSEAMLLLAHLAAAPGAAGRPSAAGPAPR